METWKGNDNSTRNTSNDHLSIISDNSNNCNKIVNDDIDMTKKSKKKKIEYDYVAVRGHTKKIGHKSVKVKAYVRKVKI